jgi:hypothetical protein
VPRHHFVEDREGGRIRPAVTDIRVAALVLDREGKDGSACLEATVIGGLLKGKPPALCAYAIAATFAHKLGH